MKTTLSVLALIVFALTTSGVQAQIVTFASPAGNGFQGAPVPQQAVPVPQQWGTPVPQPVPLQINPIVQQSNQTGVAAYDLYGRPIIQSNTQTVLQSSTNPGAGVAQPGTLRNVNRIEWVNGVQVRVTGQEWIGADGQRHGNLNRQTITGNGAGGTLIENNNVQYGSRR